MSDPAMSPFPPPGLPGLQRVLVANRGEMAMRSVRAWQALRIEAVASVSQTDARRAGPYQGAGHQRHAGRAGGAASAAAGDAAPFHLAVRAHEDFAAGRVTTRGVKDVFQPTCKAALQAASPANQEKT